MKTNYQRFGSFCCLNQLIRRMLGLEILLGEFYFRNSFKRNPIYQKCIHQLRQYFHSNLLSFFCPKTIILFLFILKKIKYYENLCFLTKGLLRMRTLSIKQLIKFGYSERATEFEKIFHLKLDVTA